MKSYKFKGIPSAGLVGSAAGKFQFSSVDKGFAWVDVNIGDVVHILNDDTFVLRDRPDVPLYCSTKLFLLEEIEET